MGFGGTVEQVQSRIPYLNRAHNNGHELASHGNGHMGQTSWSAAQWRSEFEQFNKLIFGRTLGFGQNLAEYAGRNLSFRVADIQGIRAPYLQLSQGLWPVMKEQSFRYDTSTSMRPGQWPTKNNFNVWSMPLGFIPIYGTNRSTIAMDYNFWVQDTRIATGSASPLLSGTGDVSVYERRMLNSYLSYFKTQYESNRAPVVIGHHFSKWNGGAYWRAFFSFAEKVCTLPEVKCVTHKEYADYLDSLSADQLTAYQRGNFVKRELPTDFKDESGYTLLSSFEHQDQYHDRVLARLEMLDIWNQQSPFDPNRYDPIEQALINEHYHIGCDHRFDEDELEATFSP